MILLDKKLGTLGTGTFWDEGVRILTWLEREFLSLVTGRVAVSLDRVRAFDERKRAEESLQQEEERFRYVALATRDAIYDWDVRTGRVWRNETYQSLYSPNEPVGTDNTWWEEHIYPDDRQRILGDISNAFAEQSRFWANEYRLRQFDGHYATVIDRGYILYDHTDQPVRMIGAITDITERKRAEETLHANRAAMTQFMQQLVTLQEVTNHLSKVASFDDLCRRAVEWGRSRLGFDRIGVWFKSDDHQTIVGSFGIDENGQLRDERDKQIPIAPGDPTWQAIHHKDLVFLAEDVPLFNNRHEEVGQGMIATAAMWDSDTIIGFY
jgi:PAS domain S-box-containing protein